MSKALESGKSMLSGILAKLPENLRGPVSEAFGHVEAEAALTQLGDATLARSDYSRLTDEIAAKSTELEAWRTELNTWWQAKQTVLAEYDQIKPEYDRLKAGGTITPPAPKNNEPPKDAFGREDVAKMLEDRDEGYAGVLAVATTLAAKHLRDFNEVLDIDGCIADARKGHITLIESYNRKYADKLKAKADAEAEAAYQKRHKEDMAKENAANVANPFPLRNASPSVLDILEQKGDPSKHTVDTATALYDQLSAARG